MREFLIGFLLCDEVGLGKTIEAGLVLRTLILRGELNRVLIIAPRSLIRQWMEELREKSALTAWFFDGHCLRDVGGRVRWTDHPWDEDGIIIVSRHLTDTERELYNRIDDLCSHFYRLADLPEEERSGMGFLMAVFRKRLASCFAAFQRSLERRRDLIATIQQGLSDSDARRNLQGEVSEEEEDEDFDTEITTVLDQERQHLVRLYHDPNRRDELEAERLYLQDYMTALGQVAVDSKFEAFQQRLATVVAEGHCVLVFTQYLDTLDFIRDQLVARYGDRMACYSGRGGEIWDPVLNAWRVVVVWKGNCERVDCLLCFHIFLKALLFTDG